MGDVANFPRSLIENHDFITDLARYAENLCTEQQIKKKYHFDDNTWAHLGEDDALVEAIEAEKIRRVRNGSTARVAHGRRQRTASHTGGG